MRTLDQNHDASHVGAGDDIGPDRSGARLETTRMCRREVLQRFVAAAAVGALGHALGSGSALAAESFPSSTTRIRQSRLGVRQMAKPFKKKR